jgi:hypothetical protein
VVDGADTDAAAGAGAGAAATVTAGAASGCFANGAATGGAGKEAVCCAAAGAAGAGRETSAGTAGSAIFAVRKSLAIAASGLSLADADWDCSFNAGARIRVLKLMEYWLQELTATGFAAPTATPLTNFTVAMPAVNCGLSANFSNLSLFHCPLRTPLFAVPEKK